MEWLVAIALVALAFGSLVYEQKRRQGRTPAEYERDVKAGTGLAKSMFGAGLAEVDKAFAPSRAAIHETTESEKRRRESEASPETLQ